MKAAALAAFASLIVALPLSAQDPADSLRAYKLDDINVTAERHPSRSSDAAAVVRSVTRSELERRAASDVTTVLRDVPGIQLDPVVGSGAGVALQGLGSDRVLILLDGSPLAGRIGGEFDLSRVSPSQLERIEIVEGPQSTLYGSSALGGVVNLLTRNDFSRRAEVSSHVGSEGQLDGRGRVSGRLGNTGLSLDAGRRTVDLAPGTGATTIGTAGRWDGMARMATPLGGGSLDARVLGIIDEQSYRTSSSPTPATNFNDNWQLDGLMAATLDAAGRTEVRLHGSLYDHRFISSASGERADGAAEWDRQRLLDAEVIRRGIVGDHRWLVGVKGEREWLESERIEGGSRAAWTGAAFASGDFALTSKLRASTGVRLTSGERWGTDVAPRVGLVATLPAGAYIKIAGARGFRAPSFKEQYTNFTNSQGGFTYTVLGNADLDAEHSWNASAEIGRTAGGTRLYVRGFHNWLDNFIETELVDPATSTFRYQNVSSARTAGLEGGVTVSRGIMIARASHAWLSTEDESTGEPLLGQAANTSRASLTMLPGPVNVTGEVVYTGAVPLRRTSTGTQEQADYARVNLSGGVSLPSDLRLTVGADNLFDTRPEGAATFLGRRFFAGLSWGFGW